MATKTWKGPSGSTTAPKSGNWNKSSNWSPSGVPGTTDDVFLDGGSSTYTLTLNVAATVNSLTINDSNATLAIGTSTLTVTGATGTAATGVNDQSGHITIAGGKINAAAGLALASATSSLSGWGTVAASLSVGSGTGGGTVTASGGTLDLAGTVASGINLLIATGSAS